VKEIKGSVVISTILLISSPIAFADGDNKYVELDQQAEFIEGKNLVSGAPYGAETLNLQPDTLEQKAAGISTVKVDRDGTQYEMKVSVED
jgi:hypothetical protein